MHLTLMVKLMPTEEQHAAPLVAKAKGTGRGMALEDLKGIRERISVCKAQRRVPHSWGFRQLRSFVECGFAGPADAIAAENICRAARMRPDAAGQPA